MIRRIVVAALAVFAMIAAPMVANAAPSGYPAPPPALTVSATSVVVGGSVTISGSGFTPGETIDITVTYQASGLRSAGAALALAPDATTVADAAGNFSATVTLTQPGTATITATGQTSGRSVSVVVHVAASAATVTTAPAQNGNGSGNLSYTGVNRSGLILMSIAGLLALLIGGGLVWLGVTRRRPRYSSRV